MFEDRLEGVLGDQRALADLAAKAETQSRRWGCRKLVIAAAWADAHSAVDHPDSGILAERLVSIGPAGTPAVAEFAAHGLVGPFATSVVSARAWMGDALTIRHRLPRLWERVQAGEVHAWQARQVATVTAHLSVAVAGVVDEQTAGWIGQLPWASFLKALDAAMLEVDEKTYRERERMIAAKREVRAIQSEDGLRTLIARGEAGDVAMLLALHQRVAECLADDGDEDPLPVRMSKAMGWIANPARVVDLLARHAGDDDPYREPWEQVAAHEADETDPWADDLPPAGWETPEHSNYHQPGFDDDCWTQAGTDEPGPGEHVDWPADPPPTAEDLAWFHDHTDRGEDRDAGFERDAGPDTASSDADSESAGPDDSGLDSRGSGSEAGPGTGRSEQVGAEDSSTSSPTGERDVAHADDDTSGDDTDRVTTRPVKGRDWTGETIPDCPASKAIHAQPDTTPTDPEASTPAATASACARPHREMVRQQWPHVFRPPGWRALTRTELAACAPTVAIHVHVTDQTLRDGHGVVRTDWGPILLEQLQRFLLQHEAHVKIYPVIDPADTASADSYEIPLRLRRAMAIRHPRSVFPHSPTTKRTDLDHTPAYQADGPPGQTGMHTLGPLARSEHRAKTVGKWRSKQPEPGTYLWRSPEGWIMITTNQGTLTLGHTPWATHLWEERRRIGLKWLYRPATGAH